MKLVGRPIAVAGLSCLMVALNAAVATAAPANADFGDARAVRVGTTVAGSVTGATKQRGEPAHGQTLATHSVWYRFTARRKVALGLNTCRASFDTVVAVYTGRSVGNLRVVDFNNDGCGSGRGGSRVTFTARRGRTYRIAVAGFSAAGGFRMLVRSVRTPPNDDFLDAAPIRLGTSVSGTTANSTRELGEPRHDGKSADQTVWFRLRVDTATTVGLNTCEHAFDTVLAVYTGRSVDRLTRVVSNDDACGLGSRVEFAAAPGVTYRIALAEYAGGSGSYRLQAQGGGS
jgi:hypothetical protein